MATKLIVGQNLIAEKAIFLLCDFQEAFRSVGYAFSETLEVSKRLVEASKLLEIPLIVTEQYPKGLGRTAAELDIKHAAVFEKTVFSMITSEVLSAMKKFDNRPFAVLWGLETHVCVQQTALDLLSHRYEVYIVADGCTSRSLNDKTFALKRLEQAGCIITTYESVLLQLIRGKDHPQFKSVQTLIKTQPADITATPKL